MEKIKIIKFAVFVMTFLLVFLTLLVGHHFIRKTQTDMAYSDISLNEPQGSEIKSVSVADNNLYILIRGGNKSDRIVVYNPKKQKKLFSININ